MSPFSSHDDEMVYKFLLIEPRLAPLSAAVAGRPTTSMGQSIICNFEEEQIKSRLYGWELDIDRTRKDGVTR
jgi:hypothetical protein